MFPALFEKRESLSTHLNRVVHVVDNPDDPPRAGFDGSTPGRRGVVFGDGRLPAGGLAPSLSARRRIPNTVLLSVARGLKQSHTLKTETETATDPLLLLSRLKND